MDARKVDYRTICTAIGRDNYKITGITSTGEITISILSDMDKKLLDKCFHREWSNKQKLKYIKYMAEIRGGKSEELMQVYLQQIALKEECCTKNGLRLRNLQEDYAERLNNILLEDEEE